MEQGLSPGMRFAELDREAHTQTNQETEWVLQKSDEGSSRSSVHRPEGGPRLGALHREVSMLKAWCGVRSTCNRKRIH